MKSFLLNNLSIKYKLVVGIVSILIFAMGLLSYVFIKKSENLLIKALESKANLLQNNFSIVFSKSIQENSFSDLQELIKKVSLNDNELNQLIIVNQKGIILATSDHNKFQRFSKCYDNIVLKQLQKKENLRFHDKYNNQLVSISMIYSKNAESIDEEKESESENFDKVQEELLGSMYISLSMDYLKDSILKLWIYSILLALMLICIGITLSYWFGSRMAKPIAIIADEVRKIASGNLDTAVHSKSNDELGQLVSDVDKMRLSIKSQNAEINEQNQELKKLDKLKDEFLANTSHELRTPLNGIIGITESLIEGAAGKLPEGAIENLKIISSSGRRLASLVNEILDFSKLRQNQMILKYKAVNLYKIVQNIFDLSLFSLKSKPIKLINNIDEYMPYIYADENRLIQIFHNIIGNAIKFTYKGSIRVEAELLSDTHVIIKIIDTGIGIAHDVQQKIFKSFVQIDGSSSRKYGGTGLGLSITKMLVDLHNGKIDVESEPDKGTTIILTMPINDKKNSLDDRLLPSENDNSDDLITINYQAKLSMYKDDPPSVDSIGETSQNDKAMNILAVDDEPVNLRVLKNYLQHKQFNLTTVSSGFEALKLIKENKSSDQKFHIVLLDVMMPEMTGYEVNIEIRKTFNLFEMPVILLTAKDQPGDLLKGFSSGANDYITKPFLSSELLARINIHGNLQKAYEKLQKEVIAQTTELQKTNKELEIAKKEAFASAKAKSSFLANMSHEIRTPMNGVIVAAELALEKELSPEVKHYLDIIYFSGKTLLGIINNILDLSKIDSGKFDLETGPFDLNHILERIAEMFIPRTMNKQIELLIDIGIDVPTLLIGDSLRLQQILINLVGNAIKFTPEAGNILIGVECLHQTDTEVELQFLVKDTGIGIKKEYLDDLFAAFTQADSSTSRKYGGTGLGLSICKQFVELMNGKIWVESELNKGSIFYFTTSLIKQSKSIIKRDFNITKHVDIKHVLVVDDNYESRILLKKIFKTMGMETSIAPSGVEALEYLSDMKTKHIDIIFMDLKMPGIDGIETSKKIRLDLKLDIPIILLTAFGEENTKSLAREAGINGFLIKPSNCLTIYNKIMDILGKEELKQITQDQEEKTSQTFSNKKELKGYRVLVAEDNPTNQDIAKAVLEQAGIVVTIADNGEEAIKNIYNNDFDAVLMDLQMPIMDGYTATKEIRKNKKFNDLPILAMTAHALESDKDNCLKAGMDFYISKPINQHILFDVLSKTFKQKRKNLKNISSNIRSNDNIKQTDFNVNYGVEKLGLNQDIYTNILIRFKAKHIDIINKIKNSYHIKDWDEVTKIAHSLKGAFSNIGANRASFYASSLEMLCKEKDMNADQNIASAYEIIEKIEAETNQVFESIDKLKI